MPFREFQFQWEFEFQATPEQLWPFVADTNRFNRDTKVPQLQFDSDEKRLRNARRRGAFTPARGAEPLSLT